MLWTYGQVEHENLRQFVPSSTPRMLEQVGQNISMSQRLLNEIDISGTQRWEKLHHFRNMFIPWYF